MNDNKSTNNSEVVFTVSNTTSDMLNLLRDFNKWQNIAIGMFAEKENGQEIIDATVLVYRTMLDFVVANIRTNIIEAQANEI